MKNYDELDVKYGDVKGFWKKSEKERYKYFRNCCYHYFGLNEVMQEEYKAPKEFINRLKSVFMNISFFLVYIILQSMITQRIARKKQNGKIISCQLTFKPCICRVFYLLR